MSGVEAGALVREVIKVWMKEPTCLLGSNQIAAAIFCHKDRGALDINKRPSEAMRTSLRSPTLVAKLAKIDWTCGNSFSY